MVVLALALAAACRTERSHAPAGLATSRPILLSLERAWRVVDGGDVVGIVVRFAVEREPASVAGHVYSVRNPLEQELGTIDGLGRAWRFEPHASEPRWVATGTVIEGARAILSASTSSELVEVPLAGERE